MTNIDFSQAVSRADKAAQAAETRAVAIKADCGRRIVAVLDQTAQANLTGAYLAGKLSKAEKAVYAQSIRWIGAMRARCAAMIDNPAVSFEDDANWPAVPADVAALAAHY